MAAMVPMVPRPVRGAADAPGVSKVEGASGIGGLLATYMTRANQKLKERRLVRLYIR
jgi:hypothetical protein